MSGFMCITFDEIKNCEVIDIRSGRRLGYVCDMEIDLSNGRITALIVPGERAGIGGWCRGLFRREELRIPWEDINKITPDVILVCGEHMTQICRSGAWKKR